MINVKPNYTIENFEKWLNADKSRKKGLRGWFFVISKVKSDSDLFNSLAAGQDLGGWNISDPEFRKEYKFEDYYQVFSQWKMEMDSEDGSEKPDEEEKNKHIHKYPALSITEQELVSEISSVGTKKNKNTKQMPYGSVLLTDTGTSSELKNQGINFIIHAAMMPLSKNRNNEKEFIKVATLAIQNSIILADRQKLTKLATCFLGGNIYCPVEEVKPILAEEIIRAGLSQLEKCSHLKKIVFVDFDGDYYKNAWEKIEQGGNYSEIIKKTKVVKGDLLKKSTHKSKIIINSENAEMEWRNGISGAIEGKLGSEAEKVDEQRKKLMRDFYSLKNQEGEENSLGKSKNSENKPITKEQALKILGLTKETKLSKEKIRNTYKKFSLRNHPDKLSQKLGRSPTKEELQEANEEFERIKTAYEILMEEVEIQAFKKKVKVVVGGLAIIVIFWLIWKFLFRRFFRN